MLYEVITLIFSADFGPGASPTKRTRWRMVLRKDLEQILRAHLATELLCPVFPVSGTDMLFPTG